ncbi:RICIN domain-containing protein [Spirulina major]|uniref:RICIN domain-containing protein n=1 Tax=Spirulina major TaxID=270636 RepID=UPI00093515EE|nr:RICIN domain-containing protein [Spirulina major]
MNHRFFKRKHIYGAILTLLFLITTSLTLTSNVSAKSITVHSWITTPDQHQLLQPQDDISFTSKKQPSPLTINLNPNTKYQQMDGFGAALTDSSAWLIANKLSPTQRNALLNNLFESDDGIGLNILRLPMGASDFALSNYTYNDHNGFPDLDLSDFSIQHDTAYIIPTLQQIKQVNPAMKVMGSPWSAPGWMKTTRTNKCLDVQDWSENDGGNIQQWDCTGNSNQAWQLEKNQQTGHDQIISAHSKKCLDVQDWSENDGGNIQQWDCTGNSNQAWHLEHNQQTGHYQIISAHSKKCLDVQNWSENDGGNIQQWDCTGNSNQAWHLEHNQQTGHDQIIPIHSKKTEPNGGLNRGILKPQFYTAYADYFTKFIQSYESYGIPIYAISVQNEPHHESDYPTMRFESGDMARFIKDSLGPSFLSNNIKTKILIWDHNWDEPNYPISILNQPEVRDYIAGSAFHCYAGDVSNQTIVHNSHPDKDVYFTECSGGGWERDFGKNLSWQTKYLTIGATRNWAKTVLLWNLALDENNGPKNGGCQDCRGVVTINSNTGSIAKEVEYYVLGHISKFVDPGAYRIESNSFAGRLENVAFQNPDGSLVLLALNPSSESQMFNVQWSGKSFTYSLSGGSVATLIWNISPS